MRPVDKGADPPYTKKSTFSFSRSNVEPIKAVIPRASAQNVPIDVCLDVWLLKAKGLPPNAGKVAEQTTAVSAIQKQVGDLYKLASVPLTQRLGPFCSFCETPLPGLLEVEHCVPKAPYPTFSTSWANFLLACSPCNTAKGNDPSRATVTGWIGGPSPTEGPYYNSIRDDHYVWPDLSAYAFRWMPIELQYKSGNTWKKVDDNRAYNWNSELVSTDISTRKVVGRLVDSVSGTYIDAEVRAYLKGAPASNGRANAMIGLCGLNVVNNHDSTYDRRLMNRTMAWFTYLKFFKMYYQAPAAVKPAFFQMLEMMAVATGFYSIWVQCLAYNDTLLAKQFVTDTNKAGAFPGTYTSYVP